jgi:hypothetical protein
VDGTGSGSCPMTGFGISGVEHSGSASRKLFGQSFELARGLARDTSVRQTERPRVRLTLL